MEIAEFLLARIAEDEATYRGAMHMGCVEDKSDGPDVIHSATCPNRVLAECDAKRRIVGWHKTLDEWVTSNDPLAMSPACDQIQTIEQVMEAMSRVYAEHPDYNPEWKP